MYLRWHSNLLNGIKRAQSKYQEFISRVDSVMIILKRKKKCFGGMAGRKKNPLY